MTSIPREARIQTKLLQWFKKNKRDLPWRKTKDPYAIWVSEIMLQQTQVTTVIPYYQRFLKSFPTVRHLATADLTRVLKLWEGLGYYSRARNLHRASQIVLNHFHGSIPNNLKDLLGLPGIGRSTAGAILSIAFNREAPILDGNVKRVLSRLFAVSANSEKIKTENALWQISESLIPKGYSNPFNQALMDLGSMICTPKDPLCMECPLRGLCKGRRSGEPERFPLRIPKKKIPHVEAFCAVIWKRRRVLLNQRPPSGLLGGLWEFPNWKNKSKSSVRLRGETKKETGMNVEVKESVGTFKQTFSHFKLTLHVYHCQPMEGNGKGKWVSVKDLPLLPMSSIHRKIAKTISSICNLD
jgi:A/G-specific adenine glycosylase